MDDRFSDSQPAELSFQRDLSGDCRQLISMRWGVGSLVLIATAFAEIVLEVNLPVIGLVATGLAILGMNTYLTLITRPLSDLPGPQRRRRARQLVIIQILFDWVAMFVALHFTGGITSPALPFILVHGVVVAILLSSWMPYAYLALTIAILTILSLLERSGAIPHWYVIPALPLYLHRRPLFIAAQLSFIAITSSVVVYLTAAIMNRLIERERRVTTLLHTANTVSSIFSLSEVLDRLARGAAHALNVRAASIRLLDETGDNLNLAAAYGLSQNYVDKGPVDATGSQFSGEVLEGHPVIIDEVETDSRLQYQQQIAEEGIRSILAVPITGRGKPVGILRVYSDQPHRFSDDDADFIMAIASQGAIAVENAIAYETLYQSDSDRAQFVRMVTHELRSPVGGAQSLLRTLLRGMAGDLTEQQQDLLGRLEVRLDLLLDLINDLLALAESKTVGQREPLKRIPLQPVLGDVIKSMQVEADSKKVSLAYDAPFEIFAVLATEEGLVRVFRNLIGNAIKYTPSGGSVTVRVVERPSGAVISVADTGIGIPKEEISLLWNDFFRASNARRSKVSGTGLGLSIVKQLIDHFGGSVSVHSIEGEGTTFKVTLQIASPADEAA
ncbi:MAG: GAF domain-containing sensor histidine kinase [Anaerolineae bacterium]|nr:GAF domain-containing sensor histidine kinase [Anaerolineae bacterium]